MKIFEKEEIEALVNRKELIKIIENSFRIYESGNFYMPDRMHVHNGENTLLLMPCFSGEYFSTKLVSVFPKNVEVYKPVIYGNVILNSGNSGEPFAVMDGAAVTSLRTGAVGATAIKYLSDENATTLGIIGAGVQGVSQVLFAMEVRDIKTVFVVDFNQRNMELLKSTIQELHPNVLVEFCDDSVDLCRKSEIVITSTTSEKPVVSAESDFKNKCFIGIGSYKPNMREFPDALFNYLENVFVDTDFAKSESGDLNDPINESVLDEKNVFTLGKVINGDLKLNSETQFFKSVGMALFDLEAAKYIFEKDKALI